MDRLVIRPSEIKEFKRCRRQWEIDYIWRNGEYSEPTRLSDIGSVVHKALEHHYRGDSVAIADLMDNLEPTDRELADRMITGYLEWLDETGEDDGFQIEGVEMELEVPLAVSWGISVVVQGHVDLLATDPWGLRWLIDHKTVQGLEQYARQLQVDSSMLTYAWMLRELGTPVHGAIHNALRRVKRTAAAKPPFYQRNVVRYSDIQLDNHYEQLKFIARDMVVARGAVEASGPGGAGVNYPSPNRDCTWDCPHISLCPSFDDGTNVKPILLTMKNGRI